MTNPNDYQVGGDHYRRNTVQHWDLALELNLDYFQGVITKYLDRCDDKHDTPVEDLRKALHYLQKYNTAPQKRNAPTYTEEQFSLIERYLSQIVGLRRSAIHAIMHKRLYRANKIIEELLEIENGSCNDNETG